MYLTRYVKKFGNYNFKEMPFNEVDACILATAVYSNFEVIAPSIHDNITKETYLKDIFNFDLTIVTAGKILSKDNTKLIPAMRKSTRFGNIGIKYISKVFDLELSNQFYACTYIIHDVGIFIAFRGTDSSVVGWKEDLMLSTHDVILSQLDALDYLNIIAEKEKDVPIYVGGHSKGGNLTLFSSLKVSKEVRDRIVYAYSFDGNGLSKKEYFNLESYQELKKKIRLYKPQDPIISEIMYNPPEYKIIKSSNLFIFQHDTHSWKINKETGLFIESPKRTKHSYIFHTVFEEWLEKTPIEDKKLMINLIVNALGGVKITIFDYFFSFGKLERFIKIQEELTEDEKKRLKNGIILLKDCYKNARLKYR